MIKKLNLDDCLSIGKNIAKLHKATSKLKLNRSNSLSIKLLPSLLSKIDRRINKISSNLKTDMKFELKYLSKIWPNKLPKGVIHSDLFIDNIFFLKENSMDLLIFIFHLQIIMHTSLLFVSMLYALIELEINIY